ncbi:MAG TPA: hypothetical protein VHO29_02815 [Marmoricola sp.]|nr:hypothetical protein [Marmoricola sp.]
MAGHVTAPVRHSRTRRAWIAVWTIPVGFVVAMVVGEGLAAALGYESSDEDAPAGVMVLAGGAATLVFLVPCVAAWLLGRRAVAGGEPQGSTPALVGAVVGVVFVLLNLVQGVARVAGF